LEPEMRAYTDEMMRYKHDNSNQNALLAWQFALNLMGKSEDPTVLTGEAMNQDKLGTENVNTQFLELMRVIRIILAYYFGRYEQAWELLIATKNFEKSNGLLFMIWRKLMFEGLTAFALARQTKKSRWRKRGAKIGKKLKKMVANGNSNCAHVVYLFTAEDAAIMGEDNVAMEYYNLAISESGRAGLINDKALINERFGEFFLSRKNEEEASFHLNIALQHYVKWGAMAKAHDLRKKHVDTLRQTLHHYIIVHQPSVHNIWGGWRSPWARKKEIPPLDNDPE